MPKLGNAGTSCFTNGLNLRKICLPILQNIPQAMCDFCNKLVEVDLPNAKTIATEAFQRATLLTRVILRNSVVCTLSHKYAFRWCYRLSGEVNASSNPEGLKDGYIYVPRDLVESYKTATNWSNFATQFRALEDYTVDGTTTGALDESKI